MSSLTESEFFTNKQYFLSVAADLINDEQKRILSSGLATEEMLSDFFTNYINNADSSIECLAKIHAQLQSIKLPNDFRKMAADEKFYQSVKAPYKGEKFYDLSSLKPDVDAKLEKQLEKALKEYIETEEVEEDHLEDCACDSCDDVIATTINRQLEKIASSLGARGQHEAAYLIEKTIRSIR